MNTKIKLSNLFITVILWFASIQSYAQLSKNQLKTLDSALVVLHEKAMFNGVVLIAQNGKVQYQKALGIANLQTQTPLSTASSFNLASISKQFIAMMIMQLKEKNLLQYDDKVQQFLPNFPYKNISIRQLLTHTSGLPEYFDLAIRYNNTLDTLNNDKLIQLLADVQPALNFESGSKWEYCNTAYVLLASIIEKVGGMPVEDFFNKNITQPLHLSNTFIYYLNMKNPLAAKSQRVFGSSVKTDKTT